MRTIKAEQITAGDTIMRDGQRLEVLSTWKPITDPDAIWIAAIDTEGKTHNIAPYRWDMLELAPRPKPEPRPWNLSGNRAELLEIHGEDHAIMALDAEFWTNEFHAESANHLNSAVRNAERCGLGVSWPMSGDTIAAIRGAAA